MIEAEVKKWGNSLGIILPADKLQESGIELGDRIEITIIAKKRVDGFGLTRGAPPFLEEQETHPEFW